MTASLSGVFNLQEFTDAGALMASGRLYTYTAATTTLKTAYTDAAGSTPHTYTSDGSGGQYIALNARGELPAPLFLASGAYDITLKTSSGTTVWTRRAQGADISLRDDLADSTSASKASGLVSVDSTDAYASGTVGAHIQQWISPKDYPWLAKMDGSSDDAAKVQACFDWIGAVNEQAPVYGVEFTGTCKISAGINLGGSHYFIRGAGVARIQPTVLTGASTFALFNFTSSQARLHIEGLTLYMYGSACTGIKALSLYRQVTIRNVQFVGATGLNLAAGGTSDMWGVGVEDCRFQDCTTGANIQINGQTFVFRRCLFFNCARDFTASSGTSNGSQLLFDTCIFENDAATLGKCMTISGIKEVTFLNCQGERLGYRSADTGASGDYEFVITNSTVTLIGSRLWGGSYGSVAPGNSRGFGMYLDGSRLKLINSRVYSFRKVGLKSVNGATVSTDLESQLDFRCYAGSPVFLCDSNLGDNQITSGDYAYWNNNGGSKPYPLGWSRVGSAGTPARTTTNLLEPTSVAAIDLTSSTEPHYTNFFKVKPGEWVTFRAAVKAPSPGEYVIALDTAGTQIASYDPTATYDRLFASASTDPTDTARTNNSALIVFSFQVPANTFAIRFKLNGTSWFECVAAYRGVKANVTLAGSLYSDNDASYGCYVHLAPPIPYKPSPKILTDTLTAGNVSGYYYQNDRLEYTGATSGGFSGLICTVSGLDGAATLKTFAAIS